MPEAPNCEPGTSTPDLRREIVGRVCRAPALNGSRRLCELLAFLSGWIEEHPGEPLTEERIGVAVFGRSAGFDTGTDPIVRVQMSHLRKKLESYFETEGAAEPIVIELPKRSYVPVFHTRDTAKPRSANSSPDAAMRWKPACLWLSGVLLVVAMTCGWLAWDNTRLRNSLPSDFGRTPLRDRLWREMFRNGLPAQVVVSDATSMILADEFTHLPTLFEYRNRDYPRRLIESEVKDPAARDLLGRISPAFLTTLQDARVATQVSRVLAPLGVATSVVYARDFRFQPAFPGNLILVGHRKANPWAEAFEQQMNFRYAWEPGTPSKAKIVNRTPLAGELPFYGLTVGSQGYAVVARVPKPVGNGAVLLLEGTDMGSVEAGCELLTTEQQLGEFYRRLRVRTGGPIPYFEVLLRTHLLGGGVHTSCDIVAFRILRGEPSAQPDTPHPGN